MYYKVLTRDLKSPNQRSFSWSNWKNQIFSVSENELKISKHGLHLYKTLDNLTIGSFGPRIFEAMSIGEIVDEGGGNVVCSKVKLIKEINVEFVNDPEYCYLYCKYIKDNDKMWSKINTSKLSYLYCLNVKDRSILRHFITESKYAYMYCRDIFADIEVSKRITEDLHVELWQDKIKNMK